MFTPGFAVELYVGGTATAMVAEATTEVTPGVIYQVTATAKRVLNPGAALSVDDAGGPVASGNYTVDYLTGTLTFTVPPTSPVTLTAQYIPLLPIGTARTAAVNSGNAVLDTSHFNSGGDPSTLPGMGEASATITDLEPADVDLDPGAGTTRLINFINTRSPMFLKVNWGGGRAFLGWGFLGSRNRTAPVKDLVTAELSWQASLRRAFGRSEIVAFTDQAIA